LLNSRANEVTLVEAAMFGQHRGGGHSLVAMLGGEEVEEEFAKCFAAVAFSMGWAVAGSGQAKWTIVDGQMGGGSGGFC
jgi:hypothetical protein